MDRQANVSRRSFGLASQEKHTPFLPPLGSSQQAAPSPTGSLLPNVVNEFSIHKKSKSRTGPSKGLNVSLALDGKIYSPEPSEVSRFFTPNDTALLGADAQHMSIPVGEETILEEEEAPGDPSLKHKNVRLSLRKRLGATPRAKIRRDVRTEMTIIQNPFDELEVRDFIRGIEEHQKGGYGATIRGMLISRVILQGVDLTTART